MMSPHTESDEVLIRGKSSEVMKRLLKHLKPYPLATTLTILALIAATGAELLSPLVMRRALDDHILHSEIRVHSETAVTAGFTSSESGTEIGEYLYIPETALSDLSRQEKDQAETDGWIDNRKWYVFEVDEPLDTEIISDYPEIFQSGDNQNVYAVKLEDLQNLESDQREALRSGDIAGLGIRSLQYLGLLVAVLIFTFAQVYAASWIGQRVMADIRSGLLGHIMRQSLRYLGKTPVGSLVSRAANDVETINEFFSNVTISFLKDFAIMGGVIFVIFTLDQRLALVALTTVIPTFILIVIFRNRMRESFRKVRARVSRVNAYLSERLGGMGTLQLFGAQKRSQAEFREKGNSLLAAELGQMRIMAVFRPLIELIASSAVALVIWYSTGLHDAGLVSLGVLIAFVDLVQKFFQPVKDIAEKFNILQSAMAGGERIFDMLDTVDRIPDGGDTPVSCDDEQENGSDVTDTCGDIRFEDVYFSYVPGEPVLKGLDFRITRGSTVAIVGATGAGKTTIANLLTRLWDPDEGRILLDGRDIRERPLPDLRRTVQPVQQDVFLFSGTIADNIHLGRPMSPETIKNAAVLSRADAFIEQLPEKYETHVNEGASNFSAGQRQLIAFARIIAHDPRVIILDEATANVDTETESLLQEGLDSLLQDRTALIIAHRLSTIRRADRILVLGHGKLLEEGNHDELIARKGVYHNLYKLQFEDA